MKLKSVALDGPSGAGKSVLARRAAKHFGFIYVDTGALYRCIGLHTLRNGIGSKDKVAVSGLLGDIKLDMMYDDDAVQRVLLNGEDVSDAIRMPEVSIYASDVSAFPVVRAFLLDMQREMAEKYDVIMDGRDIGTVVLPNAGLKVFLTAKPEVRAQRRYLELKANNIETSFEDVLRDINIRDQNDSGRDVAPLRAADDAVLFDTSDLNLEESISALCEIIAGRFGL